MIDGIQLCIAAIAAVHPGVKQITAASGQPSLFICPVKRQSCPRQFFASVFINFGDEQRSFLIFDPVQLDCPGVLHCNQNCFPAGKPRWHFRFHQYIAAFCRQIVKPLVIFQSQVSAGIGIDLRKLLPLKLILETVKMIGQRILLLRHSDADAGAALCPVCIDRLLRILRAQKFFLPF